MGHIDNNFLTQVTEEQPLRHSVGPDTSKHGRTVLGCEDQWQPALAAATMRQWSSGEGKEQGKKQDHNTGPQEGRLWSLSGSAWKNPMGYNPRKRAPRELVAIQGLPPPRSRMVHCDKQEIKQSQQEACTDEQEAPH